MIISPLRLALFALLASLGAYILFDYVADERDAARRDLGIAVEERDGLREAAVISGEMLAARDAIDLQRTQELNDERKQNDALRGDVDAGLKRLRIRATCSIPGVPANSSAAGVADASTAELAADARQDYFTLRDQLALSKQMILGLQDHIRLVVQRTPAAASSITSTEKPQ